MQINVKTVRRWMAHNAITEQAAAHLFRVSQQLLNAQLNGKSEFGEAQIIRMEAAMARYKYTGAESAPSREVA